MGDAQKRAEELYSEIDHLARDADEYDYGLPWHEPHYRRIVALIAAALRGGPKRDEGADEPADGYGEAARHDLGGES